MKILYLGPERPRFEAFLCSFGDDVARTEERFEATDERLDELDFIVSYGYRHIIREPLIARFPNSIVNLHISLLPWNRGADPNLWSFLEDTPKGVSIHLIDAGIDTGPVFAQREIDYHAEDTLNSSYLRLSAAIENLFEESWPEIRSGALKALPQPPGGSCHRLKDRERFAHLLVNQWDTPVEHLLRQALPREEGNRHEKL